MAPILGPDGRRLIALTQDTTPGLYYTTQHHAFGVFSIQNGMVVPNETCKTDPSRDDRITVFWEELQGGMARYGRVPVEKFHLFLAETSFRFHNRDRNLYPLLVERVKHTPIYALNRCNP